MRVLVVEDDPRVASLLRRALKREGYAIDVAATGEDALWFAAEFDFDVAVLDVGIPAPNGLEVCRRLRDQGNWLPILLLTARDRVEDKVAGLDAGADDYLPKPFSIAELIARLRALTRRRFPGRPTVLRVGDLSLDPAAHEVKRGDSEISLSPKEFSLLELLMRNAGAVVSRNSITEQLWDFAHEGGSNIIDVYVRRLRKKLDRPFGTCTIETVHGIGYRVRATGL